MSSNTYNQKFEIPFDSTKPIIHTMTSPEKKPDRLEIYMRPENRSALEKYLAGLNRTKVVTYKSIIYYT